MNLIELQRALRQLRLGGTAAVLETRLRQAQADSDVRLADLRKDLATAQSSKVDPSLVDQFKQLIVAEDARVPADKSDKKGGKGPDFSKIDEALGRLTSADNGPNFASICRRADRRSPCSMPRSMPRS